MFLVYNTLLIGHEYISLQYFKLIHISKLPCTQNSILQLEYAEVMKFPQYLYYFFFLFHHQCFVVVLVFIVVVFVMEMCTICLTKRKALDY